MTFSEIEKLHDMGFTPDQILQLSGSTTGFIPVDPEPEQQPAPETAPAEEQQPAPETQPAPSANDARIEQLQTQIDNLVKQMQQNNLRTASVNILPDDDIDSKTDAAMAELIRPTIKKEGI